ncbi:hypothetical protein [Kordia sp.]|uniref:hypothetical protein n=1 Tax=Kordia sp. TaxID=1965332 RepID=UPI003B59D0BB
MDPEKELQRICDKNNGELIVEDFRVDGDYGSKIHIVKYRLYIIHNEATIAIVYDFGNSDTADFKLQIPTNTTVPDFHISSIDHLTKLVLFKSQNWKIHCKEPHLKEKIEQLFKKYKLDQLMQDTAFEPTIKSTTSKETYTIHSIFSLNFEQNTKSITSIIEFHKGLIDMIKEKYHVH